MNCTECNSTKKQRAEFIKEGRCECCNGSRKITFNRYVQYQISCVSCTPDDDELNVTVMRARIMQIIRDCFKEFNKDTIPEINRCKYPEDTDPVKVVHFYMNQFQGKDCLKTESRLW